MNIRNIFFFIILVFSMASDAEELKEYSCGILYSAVGMEKPVYMETPDFHMMDYNDKRQFVNFVPPQGMKITSIVCDRSSIVPNKYDFTAVIAGYVLYVRSPDRILVLELKSDQFTYRLIEGNPLDQDEKSEVEAMIKYFQSQKDKDKGVGHA